MMVRTGLLAALLGLVGCGGNEPGELGAESGAANAGGETSASACETDADCESQMADQCPGGSVAYARCTDGTCHFEACSSPIGTPCDDDPSTQFEGEECY